MTQENLVRFEFRNIKKNEAEQTAEIERICFPPNEACTPEMMHLRVEKVPEMFLVAVDKATGKIVGFINGLSTNETVLRDEFFQNADLYDSAGENVMILGVDVLPEYRGTGIAVKLVNMLTIETLNRGVVPYYTTDSSNVNSQKVAIKSGYVPAWSHCFKTRLPIVYR